MNKRIEISQVENGFKVMTWEDKEKSNSDGAIYPDYETKEYIAKDMAEVKSIFDKWAGSSEAPKGGTLLGGAMDE